MAKKKQPKKLYLTEEERANIKSREFWLRGFEFLMHLVNNSIVEYLKNTSYKRLGLDTSKDYPLAGNGEYFIVDEEKGTNETDTTVQQGRDQEKRPDIQK